MKVVIIMIHKLRVSISNVLLSYLDNKISKTDRIIKQMRKNRETYIVGFSGLWESNPTFEGLLRKSDRLVKYRDKLSRQNLIL